MKLLDTKKDKCKFTIQFSSADAHHLQAVDILNAQGRRKAQFIANAILHYINCSETPGIPQQAPVPLDYGAIEAIVYKILQAKDKNVQAPEPERPTVKKKPVKSEEINFDDTAKDIGEDAFTAIKNSMESFRIK